MTTKARVLLRIVDRVTGRMIADHAADLMVGSADRVMSQWFMDAVPAMADVVSTRKTGRMDDPFAISVDVQPLN